MAARRAKWKTEVWNEIRAAQRRELRESLARLKSQIRDARVARRETLVRARMVCREERGRARERARELRARLLEEMREAVRTARAGAHVQCRALFAAAANLRDLVARDRATLAAEKSYRRELRRIEAANRAEKKRVRVQGHAHERLVESDDQVKHNIPAELAPLWEKVKGRMRGTPRKSRTEAFLEYAESHAAEILAASEHEADVRLEELVEQREARDRELEALERERGPTSSPGDDVPF